MKNSLIVNALKSLGVPVAWQKYSGKENPYITFFCYAEQGEQFADNSEIITGTYVQVDVWSKDDYSLLVDQVKSNMEAAGFIRTTAQDLFEFDTLIFHKAMRFSYFN
jgi:hypothetical protein